MDDIDRFLKEDLGDEGDITSESLFSSEIAKGRIIAKEKCVIAGVEETKKIFEKLKVKTKFFLNDGDFVKESEVIAELDGNVISILKVERLALNIIGRMSGIATETRNFVEIVKKINPRATIAATRKTTPGFRKYEKKAVMIGGGEPHRMGLYDAVMIKDNHLKMVESIETAIKTVEHKIKNKIIEIEVENEKDALKAAELGVDVVMLDNFDAESARKTVEKIRKINKKILIEISGGVTIENIKKYASFADRISLGCITHSVKNIDFSLEFI
jgi:nicotinate-nucleotide pyrophosphorylase (carboxylating)